MMYNTSDNRKVPCNIHSFKKSLTILYHQYKRAFNIRAAKSKVRGIHELPPITIFKKKVINGDQVIFAYSLSIKNEQPIKIPVSMLNTAFMRSELLILRTGFSFCRSSEKQG